MKYPLLVTLSLAIVAALLALDAKTKVAKIHAEHVDDRKVWTHVYHGLDGCIFDAKSAVQNLTRQLKVSRNKHPV